MSNFMCFNEAYKNIIREATEQILNSSEDSSKKKAVLLIARNSLKQWKNLKGSANRLPKRSMLRRKTFPISKTPGMRSTNFLNN